MAPRSKYFKALKGVSKYYEHPQEVLEILLRITNEAKGTVATGEGPILINEFIETHNAHFLLPDAKNAKLTLKDFKEFLLPADVEPSGRSTTSKPFAGDDLFLDWNHHEGRYGVWSEVRERMNEEGRGP
ncbi:MAG: hypothetical protein FJ317_09215 [SAR202 cluster bacterium]|nr:hypothetical protein [SAR202 cluster bacterium]